MNKRFLALFLSMLLLFTAVVPVSASQESIAETFAAAESGEQIPEMAEDTDGGTAQSIPDAADESLIPADTSAPEEPVPADESGNVPGDESTEDESVTEVPADAAESMAELPAESAAELPEEGVSEEAESTEEEAGEAAGTEETPEETGESGEEEAGEPEETEEPEETLEELPEAEPVGATSFTPKDPADGKVYIFHSAKDEKYVLDIRGGLYASGTEIQLYTDNRSGAQQFMLFKNSNGTFRIMNLANGKMIDAKGGSQANGTQIQQYEPNNSAAQNWSLVKNADGTYTLTSTVNSRKVLDVSGGLMRNGRKIQLYESNNSIAQKFFLEEVSVPDLSGTIMLRPVSSQRMAAAPAGNSTGNANLEMTKAEAGNNYQKFIVEKADHGYYTLKDKATGKALDVAGASKKPGANVQLYTPNGTNAQKWRIIKNSDGTYTLHSRLRSDLTLTVQRDGSFEGANLYLNTRQGLTNQKFHVTEPEELNTANISVWIENARNSDRVLTKSGRELVSGDLTLADSQKLKIEPVHVDGVKDGYYVRLVAPDGLVVDIQGGMAKNNQNVRFYEWNGSDAQIWHIVENADGTSSICSKKNSRMNIDVTNSSVDYNANIQVFMNNGAAAQKWHLASMKITNAEISASDHNTVTVKASGTPQSSDDGKAYLFAVEPYVSTISGKSPVASAALSSNVTITAGLNRTSSASLLQKKLYVAIKQNGIYKVISNAFYITNPEAAATNTTAFPTAARGTKKGLKVRANDAELAKNLKCSNVAIDLPIETFLGSGYRYTYEGVTYEFSYGGIIGTKNSLQSFKNAGILVTGIFYLSREYYRRNVSACTSLIEPEARTGSHLYDEDTIIVGFNTRDAGRKKLEALFSCLAEEFGSNGLIANWVMGNEVDQYKCYNYSGDIGYNLYHETLAEQYRLFNAAIKSRWSNARCYISLDHNWNFTGTRAQTMSNRWYQGMTLLQNFNRDLTRQGKVHWDIAMHPYPSPEQDCRFWFRSDDVTNSGDSHQVTMLNASAWAAYIKMTYGSDVHICMSETGLSSIYTKDKVQHNYINEQAAAVAYAYYIAEFDKNIDSIDIHRYQDDANEMKGGWHLGLLYTNGAEKPSANVFRNMDTKNWKSVTAPYIGLVRKNSTSSYAGPTISDWSEVVSGFNGSRWNNLS